MTKLVTWLFLMIIFNCKQLYFILHCWIKGQCTRCQNVLPLAFLLWMKDFPSTCHVGLYNSSISSCHLSGSRYFMTSSTVFSPATASDNSSMPCRDGGSTAGTSGSDTICRKNQMMEKDSTEKSFMYYIQKQKYILDSASSRFRFSFYNLLLMDLRIGKFFN